MTDREKILKRYSQRLQNICLDYPSLNISPSAPSSSPSSLTNHQKRICHARLELLRLDLLEDTLPSSKSKPKISSADFEKFSSEIDVIDESLKLSFVQSKFSLFYQLHDLLRLFVVLYMLFTSGMILSLPMLFLRVTDGLFASLGFPRPYKPICIATKAFISNIILLTSGVVLKVQGLNSQTFASKRTLACFTHGSTLDAFVLGATLPIPATVLAKKELFLLPYFGWLMQAYGNVPIDRKNRNSAVVSLEIATELADSVLIAPEGTRSTTGQLLPFKKGPFHLWHSLHGPIVPIVITGAYELLPPGKSMAIPGIVYTRYLKPIQPSEATDREHMSRIVRRRILEDILNSPLDASRQLTFSEKLECFLALMTTVVLCSSLVYLTSHLILFLFPTLSTQDLIIGGSIFSVAMTLAVYVWAAYIQIWIHPPVLPANNKSSSSTPKKQN